MLQKKAPNNIFIIKSQNLKMRGVKISGVPIRLMNQNFSKVKYYTNHLNSSIFNGGKNFGGTDLEGGKNFGPLKSLGLQQLSYL